MVEEDADSAINCPVCSEEYSETGDNVPKLLCCGHTLCEKCVTLKLYNRSDCRLDCPLCGESHAITGGVNSILENRRILDRIRSKRPVQESSIVRLCEKHGREISLYCCCCNECLCVLCMLCSEGEHPNCKSDMYSIQEDKLIASRWKETLEIEKEELIQARKENEEKSKSCTEQIILEKEQMLTEITKTFDELLKIVFDDKKENDIELEDMLVKTEANIAEIDDVLKETDSTLPAVMKRMKTIMKTKTRSKEHGTSKPFMHYEYTKSRTRIQRFCGQLKKENFTRRNTLVMNPSQN